MKRRNFIKYLLSSAIIPTLPKLETLNVSNADEILRETPLTFNVDPYGELSIANYFSPPNRFEAYGLTFDDISTRDNLLAVCDNMSFLRGNIFDFVTENFPKIDLEGWEYENIETLFENICNDQFDLIIEHVNKLFLDNFSFIYEEESEPYNNNIYIPLNGYAAAYRLFAGYSTGEIFLPNGVNEREFEDLFDIRIIEGEHPGSTYNAAELGISISEANSIAEKYDIPIKFMKNSG
jgi:hypothetical protein